MNTKTMEQFEILDTEVLEVTVGGYTGKDCLKDMGNYIITGTGGGALWGAPAGGIGALPGAYVGAHVGAIAGGFVCMGGMIGNKFK